MKEHPLLVDDTNEFVCISDITGEFCSYNMVIYNPNLPLALRKENLQKVTFENFHFTFTNEQLDYLCGFLHTECDKFIDEFKKLKKEIKHEDW